MKLAIISDTHFGDPAGTLVDHQTLGLGAKFPDFAKVAEEQEGQFDFLVLLGDVFDFSITSYEYAYKTAKVFFEKIKSAGIAKNIIYVPGNHDVDMWNSVQQQIKIMHQVGRGLPSLTFDWCQPGFIDDRTDSPKRGFWLPGPIKGPVDPDSPSSSEVLFLNGITQTPKKTGTYTNFYVTYPNLYMVTDTESIMLTHGHYLEAFWAISSAIIQRLAKDFLGKTDTLVDLVSFNAPLCQLACSGIGQAGNLTPLVQRIQKEAKRGDMERIEQYIDDLPGVISKLGKAKLIKPMSWWSRMAIRVAAKLGKWELTKQLKKREEARDDKGFGKRKEIQERFKYYYQVSCDEIAQFNWKYDLKFDPPQKLIYGHTHVPHVWDDSKFEPFPIDGGVVQACNTGGWLWKGKDNGHKEFCGANVITYDTKDGFKMHLI